MAPYGQAELDLVGAAGWRAWPPILYPVLSRWYATKITREWKFPTGGVGYVTCFEVRRKFLGDPVADDELGGYPFPKTLDRATERH